MVAPALVLVADHYDPKTATCYNALLARFQQLRPHLNSQLVTADRAAEAIEALRQSQRQMQPASAEDAETADDLPEQLAPAEIVLVPLDVVSVQEVHPQVSALADQIAATFPDSHVAISRPLGPSSDLLTVVDARLRTVLTSLRVTELDGLVLLAPSGADARGAALLARRARQWSTHHKLPVALAFADDNGAALSASLASLTEQGRRQIAVGNLFIANDDEYQTQLTVAKHGGAVAVSAPLGVDDLLLELVMGRYAYTAMAMLNSSESSDAAEA